MEGSPSSNVNRSNDRTETLGPRLLIAEFAADMAASELSCEAGTAQNTWRAVEHKKGAKLAVGKVVDAMRTAGLTENDLDRVEAALGNAHYVQNQEQWDVNHAA